MTSQLLEAALLYASYGWRVFPLKPGKKDEYGCKSWKNDATTDEQQIRAWWALNPNYNVGVVTGNGLCVVDVDDKPEKHGGLLGSDFLRDWELEHGEISETTCAKSGTGGMHYYFDVGNVEIKGCQSDTIFIDLRCDGNYIVAPPSIHPDTGLPYTWDISPEDMKPAKATDTDKACIQWVYDHRRGADKDGKKEKVKVPGGKVHDGEGRNNFLYEQGCSARAKGADDDVIRSWLESLNKIKCVPPLDERELNKTIDSVCSLPVGLSEEAKEMQKSSGTKSANHVIIANRILSEYSACFLDGMPAVFDGLSYQVGWDMVERAVLKEWPNAKDKDRKEVIKYLHLTMPHHKQSDPRYIGFKNGVLDIETMELLAFSPDFKIPNVIPHDWKSDAYSEILENTLCKIACNDPFIENNLAEFIGLCMYRSGKYAFSAILLGKPGETASNGKSTYIDMIRAILGEDNYSSLSLHVLGERFYQDYLAGKLANLGDDISSNFTKGQSLEVFKKAVAGSELTTDVKGTKGYKFKPYCTMIFSANEFPKLENLDDGILRRLFPIRFNAHFTSDDPDFDPDIGDKLAAEEAIEAAIVRGVWGLKRVIQNRRPTDNDESRRMVQNIRVDNSSILQWLEDEGIQREEIIQTTIGYAYNLYELWCKNSGIKNKYAKRQFSKDVCNYFKFKILNTTRDGKSVRIFANPR